MKPMNTLPTPESKLIWEGLVKAEAYARYHSMLKSVCLKRYRFSQFVNGASALAAASVLLTGFSWVEYTAAALFLLAALAALALFILEDGKRAYIENQLSEQYSRLAIEWQNLWDYDLNRERAQKLSMEQHRVSLGYETSDNTRLLRKAQNEAERYLRAQTST